MNVIQKAINEMRINDLLDDITGLANYVREDCHDDFVAEELDGIIKDVEELIDDVRKSGIDSGQKEAICA
jgi:DNA-binding transcriptional regulator YhcF (GntR family)